MFIKVNYSYTSDRFQASKILNSLPEIIACDFEVASKWTKEEKDLMTIRAEQDGLDIDPELNSDGLSHPALTVITHLSIATSNKDAYVIVCPNDRMREFILNWLITTDRLQLWFNIGFDGKHIMYHTGKLPPKFEDVFLLQKCRFNTTDTVKGKAGLKQLEGHNYGDWGISKELEFSQENMFDERMLHYAAIDSCSTYNRWEYLTKKQNVGEFNPDSVHFKGYPF